MANGNVLICFKDKAMFYNIYIHIQMFNINITNPYFSLATKGAVCLGTCLLIHKGLGILNKRLRKQTKWYIVHTIGNMAISALALRGCIKTMKDPIGSIEDIENFHSLGCLESWPVVIMASIHLHHILLYFREMTTIDWVHHLGSSGFVGSVCTFYIRGSIVNQGLFFMCGLPGGIDYGMLTLTDLGVMNRMTEKRVNRYLNMYIRLPGILFNVYSGLMIRLYSALEYNPYIGGAVLLINSWNAIYFAQRVCENYAKAGGGGQLVPLTPLAVGD